MKRICWPLLFLLCLSCATLHAQDKLSIRVDSDKNQSQIAVGQLVFLDAVKEGTQKSAFAWAIDPLPPNYDMVEASSRIPGTLIFSSGRSGVYTVQLVVATNVGADVPPTIKIISHVVTVGDAPSPPSPPPTPPTPPQPPPEPPTPDFGLADIVAESVAQLVQSDTRKQTAEKIGLGLLSVVAKIKGGSIATPADAKLAVRDANRAVMTADEVKVWTPWVKELAKHLDKLETSGKLSSLADFAEAYEEIAAGLAKVQ